jgi:arabinogalactan oligomer/maltooligosaccharide transport system permease protein
MMRESTAGEIRREERPVRKRGERTTILTHIVLIALICVILFPAFYIFTAGFRKTFHAKEWLPREPTLKNFDELFIRQKFPLWAVNTAIICIGTVLLTLAMITPAAYAFSRLRFLGKKQILMFIIIAQMFPSLLGMVAIYGILGALGVANIFGMILIYAGASVPFYAWFLKGYMDTIPRAVDEAARMDGASEFQIFRKIILPLSKPALGVISFMAFIVPYNDFILPSILLHPPDTTIVHGLSTIAEVGGTGASYPILACGVLLAAIPVLLVFLFFQRYLIMGLTRGMGK